MEIITIEILLVAFGYATISAFLQRKYSNNPQMRKARNEMKRKQKEIMELTKKDPTSPEVAAKQKEFMGTMSKSMKGQLKPMLIILPVFFILYDVLLPMGFPTSYQIQILSFNLNYQGLFIAAIVAMGILYSIIMAIYDKMHPIDDSEPASQAN